MKKQLLLGLALSVAISSYPQNGKVKEKPFVADPSYFAQKYKALFNPSENVPSTTAVSQPAPAPQPVNNTPQLRSAGMSTINFIPISGSMNIYGMLVSSSSPLQYDDELNAVSFIHRKSATYQPDPFPTPLGAETGAIVGMVTTDWGNTWDSTLVWNDNVNWARYPQGGLYNPPSNTDITAAHIIATGPITSNSSSWVGSFFASKPLDIPSGPGWDNIASTTPGAQQFMPNTPPYGTAGKVDFPRYDFTVTDDGVVRSAGLLINSTNPNFSGYRGAAIVKGTFNSGTFTWTTDSVIPTTHVSGITGSKQVFIDPHMAWNESGTVGYVWHVGVRPGQTGSNVGLQPIVYKTTNGGNSWALMNGIDFNDPAFSHVLDHIGGTAADTNLKVPLFNSVEDYDAVVDMNDRLHIFATVIGGSRSHPDSIFGSWSFDNYDGESYSYAFGPAPMGIGVKPGVDIKPYLYDFYETATGWAVTLVDSMGSEGPGVTAGNPGYAHNPWDATGGAGTDKVSSNARMQMSRTPDGRYIVYSWAETDTTFSSGTVKWNINPDIHARVKDVTTGAIHPVEINVTSGSNLFVGAKAQMFYMSPKCAEFPMPSFVDGPILTVPYTVSNNQNVPLTQLLPNTHWYSSAHLAFGEFVVGINENKAEVLNSYVYPNPAKGTTDLHINLKDNGKVSVTLMNTVGQVVRSFEENATAGENTIQLNLSGLSSGIYLADIQVGGMKGTKKIVVE